MSVPITTQIIHASFASVIRQIDANANIYDNPNQQGTAYPAWFIVHRSPVEVQRDFGKIIGGNRYTLTYQIDIWYMIQQNITRLYDQYTQVAEALDAKLEYLPIFGSNAVVHVFDRSWSLELQSLKYSTTLRLLVFVDNKDFVYEPFDVITVDLFLKNQMMATLTFANEEHPDFTVELPDPISVDKGDYVDLPSVSAKEYDEDGTWTPSAWDVGGFNHRIKLEDNKTTNLLWQFIAFLELTFTNSGHPDFDVTLPDTVKGEAGTVTVLPSISGEYEDADYTYTPQAWTIGAFGETFTLNENTVADLVWRTLYKLSFTNTDHPEFDVTLPEPVKGAYGTEVELPSVSGEYEDTDYTYTPQAWSVGAFGDTVTLNDNVVANLVWHAESKIVFPKVNPIGGSSKPTLRITQTTLSASGIIWRPD